MTLASPTSPTTSRRSRNRRKILCALAVALSAIAAPIAVQLNAAPAPKPTTESDTGEPKVLKPTKKEKAAELAMTDPERQLFEEFMKNNSPKKWATYQQVRAKGAEKPRTRQLESGLAGRYRELEKIRETDAERHGYEVQAIKIEDDAYGILQEIHAAKSASNDQYDAPLHKLAGDFVDNRRAWRNVRIQRVKEELKRLGLTKAIVAIQESEQNDNQKKKNREEQITQLVSKWKQGANPPKLKGALPAGERPPTEDPPATEPANTPRGK